MILRKTKIIEGHGGGGGGHGGGHGAAGRRGGGHGAAGRHGGGYSSYPLYYNDYYTSYDPYLVGQPIYPVIQQVPNYPYYY